MNTMLESLAECLSIVGFVVVNLVLTLALLVCTCLGIAMSLVACAFRELQDRSAARRAAALLETTS